MGCAVRVQGLSKRFGPVHAVDEVSFDISSGEVLGFLGPNGAGKSTTMKMVTGFLRPDRGTVSVNGLGMASAPVAAKRLIGYLPEGAPLYPDMSVRALLGFVADVRGLQGERRRSRLARVVARLHLEGILEQTIESLSKGFKRRVGLAQALLHDPPVLVLDEPTDGLDPNQKHEVRTLIREMSRTKAILLSTHILEEVDAVCTRALVIARGRIVADGAPGELAARSPRHNAITLTLSGVSATEARRVLGNVSAVREIEAVSARDGLLRLRIHPRTAPAPVGAIVELVGSHGWRMTEIYVERGHLDEVFRAITVEGASPGHATQAPDAHRAA